MQCGCLLLLLLHRITAMRYDAVIRSEVLATVQLAAYSYNHDIWFLNNYLYIKSATLLLLPFIDSTKDDDTLFSQLKNLEDIISPIKINKDIYNKKRTTIIKKYCKFSNIMIEAITNNIHMCAINML
mmetsp:Transcript_9685/g.13339  ORF Transcript_9685/g.13339 Transcript_9685/m.13339 type:complete len:127 (-) Transcript_9685:1027-1407(-)